MTNDDVDKTSESLSRIEKEGAQVGDDFIRAVEHRESEKVQPQFGSEQVETDAPQLNHPAPSWGASVDHEAHWNAAGKDAARAEAQHRTAEKEAFLAQQRERREQRRGEPEQKRGVERE